MLGPRCRLQSTNTARLRLRCDSGVLWSQVRQTWGHYYNNKQALIFVVDATDDTRMKEARGVLRQVLEAEPMSRVPLLVLCSKSDVEGALTSEEIRILLGLDLLLHGEWYCQAVTTAGDCQDPLYSLPEGLKWLHRKATQRIAQPTEEVPPWGFVPEDGSHLLRISYPGGDDDPTQDVQLQHVELQPVPGTGLETEAARACGASVGRLCLPS